MTRVFLVSTPGWAVLLRSQSSVCDEGTSSSRRLLAWLSSSGLRSDYTSLGSARPWNHRHPIHIIARRRLFSDHRGERSLLNGRLAATIAGCPSAVHGDRRGVMQHRHFPEPTEPMTRHCSNVAYLSSSVRGRYFGCLGLLVQVYTRKWIVVYRLWEIS